MCLVELHRTPKSTSSPQTPPARIVTTARSDSCRTLTPHSASKPHHHHHHPRRLSEKPQIHTTATSPTSSRFSCQNSFTGGPARASYVSSRGQTYHRSTEKFFYGRNSGEPLLSDSADMGSNEKWTVTEESPKYLDPMQRGQRIIKY